MLPLVRLMHSFFASSHNKAELYCSITALILQLRFGSHILRLILRQILRRDLVGLKSHRRSRSTLTFQEQLVCPLMPIPRSTFRRLGLTLPMVKKFAW